MSKTSEKSGFATICISAAIVGGILWASGAALDMGGLGVLGFFVCVGGVLGFGFYRMTAS